MQRTMHWDEFPNGRWGDNRSPAYNPTCEYYLLLDRQVTTKAQRRELWGEELNSVADVAAVFLKYLSGQIRLLPWDTTIAGETREIAKPLMKINQAEFLTINSQPAVDGASSTDPVYGWGEEGGFVYQKAYLEFFCSPENLSALRKELESRPSIQFQAINLKGELISSPSAKKTTACTWGVFPGREIVQPTIVDTESFKAWKDEAFSLWISQWASIYEPDSKSCKLIEEIHSTYYLVNMVDNNYRHGDIFEVFMPFIAGAGENGSKSDHSNGYLDHKLPYQ